MGFFPFFFALSSFSLLSLLPLLSLSLFSSSRIRIFDESRLGRARFTPTIIPVPGEFSLPASISFHPPWHDSCRTLVIMRGESRVSHRGIIRKCFPRHSRPFLPRFPFFFFSRTLPLAFIIFYFVQLYARKYSSVMDFWYAQQLIRPHRLTSLADRRRSRGLDLPRLLPAALNAGRILAPNPPPPLARPFASLRSAIDMEGFFRAASFARLILRSRERNFHRAAAAGANSHGRSSIAKHPREFVFVSTDCVCEKKREREEGRERERILSFPLFSSSSFYRLTPARFRVATARRLQPASLPASYNNV